MADFLLDTNVLSRIFYGDESVKAFVDTLDAGIDTVVYIECIQGSIKKKDRELIKKALSELQYFPMSPEIGYKAAELIEDHSASRGLFLADALIAATAIVNDLTLVTFNLKDFSFIKDLGVTRP